jgi:hypothetical protein
VRKGGVNQSFTHSFSVGFNIIIILADLQIKVFRRQVSWGQESLTCVQVPQQWQL